MRGAAAVGRSGGSVWRSESGEFVESAALGERAWVVLWSLQLVESPGVAKETRTGGAALPAVSRKPACSCGESRRELTGCLAKPELNRGYASCRGDGTSRLAPSRHLEGAGNLHGLAGLVRSTKSRAIKTQEVQSDSLVFEGGLFLLFF